MSITCRQLIDFIADYIDGELDPSEREEFERHLKYCPSCRSYLQTYRQTMSLSRDLMGSDEDLEDVPEELIHTILARCAQEKKP